MAMSAPSTPPPTHTAQSTKHMIHLLVSFWNPILSMKAVLPMVVLGILLCISLCSILEKIKVHSSLVTRSYMVRWTMILIYKNDNVAFILWLHYWDSVECWDEFSIHTNFPSIEGKTRWKKLMVLIQNGGVVVWRVAFSQPSFEVVQHLTWLCFRVTDWHWTDQSSWMAGPSPIGDRIWGVSESAVRAHQLR